MFIEVSMLVFVSACICTMYFTKKVLKTLLKSQLNHHIKNSKNSKSHEKVKYQGLREIEIEARN
jgi:UDP-N-acetylmuramyl pentapeptide phosphotransferase/UDP-N-acetylglucosamine-1-phosphate transferase